MSKITFNLDPAFFDELASRCETERVRINEAMGKHRAYVGGFIRQGYVMPREIHPAATIPSRNQLKRLVATVFWASLEREEGRPLAFNVAYDVPPTADGYAIKFQKPLPFNVRAITKLAPATRGLPRALAASPAGDESLEIGGLLMHSVAPLKVKCLDPGRLVVSYAGKNVALISGAEAAFIRQPDLRGNEALWGLLKRVRLSAKYPAYPDVKVDTAIAALREMRRLGHGGALIIVPFGDQWKASTKQPAGYSGQAPSKFLNRLVHEMTASISEHGQYSDKSSLLKIRLEEAARNLAQLTAVDGVVVIDCELDILGFSVKIEPGPDYSDPAVIYNIDALERADEDTRTELSEVGGMRHQSAARFVFNQREAVALVASQDKNVTGMAWQRNYRGRGEEALCLYRNLELTLF